MALPKEPRQKMINFMYLVLTAMLALNVSTEILHAFKVVDNSLRSSNTAIDNSSLTFIRSLEDQGKKPELAAKVAEWKPRADQALVLTKQMTDYMDNLKLQVKQEADLKMKDGIEDFKEDDLDAATRLMDVRGEGPKLLAKLEEFKAAIANVIPADVRKRLPLPQLPLDLTPPKLANEASNTWTTAYFHMTPTVAALTMLSKFQNDVKRSGNIVVNYCHDQIGKVEVIYDKFVALTSQNSEYLLPGQPFQIQAGLGSFSSKAVPTVSVNGQNLAVNDSGYATYRETAGGGGQKSFNVVVSFKDPSGNMQSTTKVVHYTVGVASGASIFLEKMNVMYIGVDNPITISAGSIKREGMNVSIGGGTLNPAGGDRYIARVTSQGETKVTVSGEGKSFSFPIRVKELPPPTGLVGTATGGVIPAAQFKAMGGVRAVLQNSEFQADFSVEGYTIGSNCGGTYSEIAVNGAQWGNNAVIGNLKPGCLVWIGNLRAKWPSGKVGKIPEMAFRLQ